MSELKKRIVVVEDERDILELINLILTRAGYEVYLCDNGRNALDLIKKVRPHLVVLDVMLPGMDGKAIVAAMAADEDLQTTSVMITSALEESAKIFSGNPLVKDFCFKPFRTSVLLEKVKKIMGDA
ncbi:MAG: response regulator [Elusimicrobiota bacterium]|jgi:two-component system alkaline phosphatase synthesis response regulator PhoP|nr:response regulator [Elusimicrobiota bacterium]